MALAVTHVLVAIVILDIFRHYVFGKKRFPRYLLVIGGIAGLLPDIDVPVEWLILWITGQDVVLHRLFTHNIFLAFLFLVVAIILHYWKKMTAAKILYVVAAGWFLHIFLDCFYGGGIESLQPFLWPLAGNVSFCPTWNVYQYAQGIDAILLVLWLVHEEIHNKIRDYM